MAEKLPIEKEEPSIPDLVQSKEIAATTTFPDETHAPGLLKKLSGIRDEADLCDVTFTVREQNFYAHRVIMAASSDYFLAMFTRGFKETNQKKVKIDGIVAVAFGEILSFVYTGTLRLSTTTVKDVYEAANLLQYIVIQDKCLSFILQDISPESCVDYLLMAQKHSLADIYKTGKELLFEHFEDMSKMQQFLDLPFDIMIEILTSGYLVAKEKTVLEAICYWVNDHLTLTQDQKDQLLDCLRYGLLGSEGMDCLKQNRDILGEENPSIIKDQLLHYLLNPTTQPLADPKYHTPRGPMCIVAAGGRNTEDKILDTLKIIPVDPVSTDKETREIRMPSPRTDTTIVSKGNIAYLIGGREEDFKGMNFNNNGTNKVQRFDISSETWTEMCPMFTERYQHTAAVVGDTILVIGGRDKNGKVLTLVERYSIPHNKWEKLQDFPRPVCQAAACEYKGKLYVSGGQDGDGNLFGDFEIYEYDDTGNIWSQNHFMSPTRYSHLMCSNEKGIFIVAGRRRNQDSTNIIHSDNLIFDMVLETFTELKPMPYFVYDVSSACDKDNIYAIGGFGRLSSSSVNDDAPLDVIQVYNIKTDTWSEHELRLPEPVYSCSSTLLAFPHSKIEASIQQN